MKEDNKPSNERCPTCGSTHIMGNTVTVEGIDQTEQECTCTDCGAEWVDIYTLAHRITYTPA